ncbi:hypothetical protein [Segniliparus rugosus]|uniref:Uncharacterized protein n=1 Tax=Segniliparus rugosus (strain ATCC BAA-974 / DSM 45345 / CCUG 50838 / CIP 108380 / JCM 13579 / CDC 945) TaxID=679197 RepID=E5XU03_SEGRC|nr:hypothetical protein [Segniliparus rugosus]EFV12172.2 hypothetical protein HMPREF9336_02975 [Segniliparus rugosus ATCC BAA-974]
MSVRAVFAAALAVAALPLAAPTNTASASGDECAEFLRGWNAGQAVTNRRQVVLDRNKAGESEAAHQAALRQISGYFRQEAQIWHDTADRVSTPELRDSIEGVAEEFDAGAEDPTLVDEKLGGDSFWNAMRPLLDAVRDTCPIAYNQITH